MKLKIISLLNYYIHNKRIEYCRLCNSEFQKSFEFDHLKSVNHLEKLNRSYCSTCNIFMPLSDQTIHLSSNDHKNNHKRQQIWCEDCGK